MEDCCKSSPSKLTSVLCPVCKHKGRSVPIITLKAMLISSALETIVPECGYMFCSDATCDVVYFSDSQTFRKDMLKVPVFQKDQMSNVPVCYCFGWTRHRLMQAVEENQRPSDHIREQVQANRCGCEVNNPQGSCCSGNVTAFLNSLY
jgi:hypothetical protein